MISVWQRTVFLFWQYPILWLPVLVADFAAYWLAWLQQLLTHRIVLWIVQSGPHSVLGNIPAPIANQSSTIMKAALLSAPFVWGNYFLRIAFYTVALVITAKLIRNRSQDPCSSLALSDFKGRIVPVLKFAVRVLALFAVAAILFFLLGSIGLLPQPQSSLSSFFTAALIIFFSSAIGWILAPSAIRLLQAQSATPPVPTLKRSGRLYAVIAIAVSTTIAFALQAVTRTTHGPPLWITCVAVFTSLIAAVPYIRLFIALALLANLSSVEQPPDPPSDATPTS
jgi:hypothetical protein